MAMIDVNWNPTRKELRIFFLLLILFFGLISWAVFHRSNSQIVAFTLFGTAAAIGLLGVCFPLLMKWVYVGWMIAVYPIGWVVSHLLMAFIFYLVFTPIAFIMKLIGYDSMRRKLDRKANTYWIDREESSDTKRYFRQY